MLIQQEQRQVITQRIDPKIIVANTILQLSALELSQQIENELQENPALEALEDNSCPGDCIDPATCLLCPMRRSRENLTIRPNEEIDSGDHEQEQDYEPFPGFFAELEEYDLVGNLEAELTLQEHLCNQLRAAVTAEEYPFGEYIINNLNDQGYLSGTTEGIACELNVPEDVVCRLLGIIQTFDPPGVGARNLQESLALQARFLSEESTSPLLTRCYVNAENIVRDHFEYFCAGRYTKIARALGIPVDEVKQASELIRTRLNPYPASQFRPPWAYRPANVRTTIRPDVIIRRTETGYEIDVVGTEAFSLGINPKYREEYNDIKSGNVSGNDDEKKHVTEAVERAEQFIRHLHQRRQTLRQITRCIVDYQTGFIETGSRQFLRQLTRTRVAQMLDIHESTVSRATAGKFVQLPNQEVISYDIFFDGSLSIKDAIEEIIQTEDPVNPFSDQQIVEKLQEKGIAVARRTIVKYRQSQKILSSTRRRR